MGGCYREKFFLIFIFFSFLLFDFYSYFIFFIFSDFRLVYPILGFQLNSFTEYLRFNSFNFRSIFLACSSLCFTRIDFDLFQHCRFYALTLQLFISSAYYKQTSMLIQVCFMLVLAILRLSDVFLFVLGVVYRLGLK